MATDPTCSPLPSHKFSAMAISSFISHLHHQWLLLLLLTTLFPSPSSSSSAKISYATHCNSLVPQSTRSGLYLDSKSFHSLGGYFTGGDKILSPEASTSSSNFSVPGNFHFYSQNYYYTATPGVIFLEGTLYFYGRPTWTTKPYRRTRSRFYRSYSSSERSAHFELSGFWSESTGKLCMVGSGIQQSEQGTQTQLSAVFKLINFQKVANISTNIVSGVLESLDSSDSESYFNNISILAYAQRDYSYTQMSDVKDSCTRSIAPEETIPFKAESSCSYLQHLLIGRSDLDYDGESALSFMRLGSSPRFMTFDQIQCSEDGKVHMHIGFSNGSTYELDHVLMPKKSLVSEGYWDQENNRLCLLACRISDTMTVSDCTISLSLWFPSVISIRNRTVVMGRIWSNKEKSDPDYFSMISFRNGQRRIPKPLPGLRYEYTELDAVKKSSCAINRAPSLENKQYPEVNSLGEMSFDITVRNGEVDSTWGYARPISFGQTFYSGFTKMVAVSHQRGKSVTLPVPEVLLVDTNQSLWNVSYQITYSSSQLSTEIFAEGMYNAATGLLCMVGCNYSSSSAAVTQVKDEADCEVLISVQFPTVKPDADGDRLNGTIRSRRGQSDPLYFPPLEISSTKKMYEAQARESIWRMDMEITMVLISLTLSSVFIALQLFHANRNPSVLSSVSITMVVVLTLGHMIPLVLNFEALFFTKQNMQSVLFGSGGWLEANEIIVRLMTMLALSLHLRLLQRTWTCRSAKESNKGLWIAESKGLKICLPLYFAGALITWFLHRKSYDDDQYAAWEDLVTYSGFILDGFLLPQIILNVFLNTKDRALAPLFYAGTTVIRAMPHLYDAYRARHYFPHFRSSYIYASPHGDFYSLAWDVIIPFEGILFAVLIYLQQRFGGSCFLPKKFKKFDEYERVPVTSV